MKEEVSQLIHDYLCVTEKIIHTLEVQFGRSDLLAAVNGGDVPRVGRIDDFGGGEYYVHGRGIRVEGPEVEIDFDLGSTGRVVGVDPWKLFNFADSHRDNYPWLRLREEFNASIEKLLSEGFLTLVGDLPSTTLIAITGEQGDCENGLN